MSPISTVRYRRIRGAAGKAEERAVAALPCRASEATGEYSTTTRPGVQRAVETVQRDMGDTP